MRRTLRAPAWRRPRNADDTEDDDTEDDDTEDDDTEDDDTEERDERPGRSRDPTVVLGRRAAR